MAIFLTICRALFWVAIPAAAAAYAGIYCSEHTGRDLARPAEKSRLPDRAKPRPAAPSEARSPLSEQSFSLLR